MKAPLVSVVTPTYNRADLLPATVASVLSQTVPDFELLIVDDGSTDATAASVGAFDDSRIRYFPERRCARLTWLRNSGMRHARGTFVAFLDSDDLWREDKLARQLEVLNTRPSVGFVLAGYEIFDATGVLRTKLYHPPSGGAACSFGSLFAPLIRGRMTLCSSSVLFRRSLLDDVGLQNEALLTGDYEFFTRLAWAGEAGMIRSAARTGPPARGQHVAGSRRRRPPGSCLQCSPVPRTGPHLASDSRRADAGVSASARADPDAPRKRVRSATRNVDLPASPSASGTRVDSLCAFPDRFLLPVRTRRENRFKERGEKVQHREDAGPGARQIQIAFEGNGGFPVSAQPFPFDSAPSLST